MHNEPQPHDDLTYLEGKMVAILGHGQQGREHALWLRNNGIQVVVALRHNALSEGWEEDGFTIVTLHEAVDLADLIQVW